MAQVSTAYHSTYQQQQATAYSEPSYTTASYDYSSSYPPYHQLGEGGYSSSHSGHPVIPHSSDRYQNPPYYGSHADSSMGTSSSDVRSPQASYPQTYAQPAYQSMTPAMYAATPGAGSSRSTQPYSASMGTHYPAHAPHASHGAIGVERTISSRHAQPVPYARTASVPAPEYEPHIEPTIKKKRKRADARQLEVLNATYARTAFPSTEERAALGVQLGMSARSVQIWFQNKRQSMRSGGRSGSYQHGAPPVPAPVPSPPAPSSAGATSTTGSSPSRYGRASTPATHSTRSPPGAVPPYAGRSPPPGASSYSSRTPLPQPTRGSYPYSAPRGY